MGKGEGVGNGGSPPQPTRGSGERRELPQWGPWRSPGRKRISVLSKRHRTLVVETLVVNWRPVRRRLLWKNHSIW